MDTTRSLPVRKRAWVFLSVVVFLLGVDFLWDWPMGLLSRFTVLSFVAVGAVFLGWLLQFLWGFLAAVLSRSPRRRSLKRKIFVWIIRAVYISVLMATIDSCTGYYYGHPIFSMTMAGMSDGGTTMTIGPGYFLTFWRRMDGAAYGPEIWFWFTPFIVDAAHHGLQVHWLWSH